MITDTRSSACAPSSCHRIQSYDSSTIVTFFHSNLQTPYFLETHFIMHSSPSFGLLSGMFITPRSSETGRRKRRDEKISDYMHIPSPEAPVPHNLYQRTPPSSRNMTTLPLLERGPPPHLLLPAGPESSVNHRLVPCRRPVRFRDDA